MKAYVISGITLLLLISLLIPGQAFAGKTAKKMSPKAYILSIDQTKAKSALNTILKTQKEIGPKRFTTLSKYTGRDYYVVNIKDTEQRLKKQLLKISEDAPGVTLSPPAYRYFDNTLPNDPEFARQWCHVNLVTKGFDMASDAAWEITTGSSDVIVAVLDSGVDYLHPELAPNMWINENEIAGNNIDDDGNGYVDDIYGIDTGCNDSNPMDFHGHGTHCAGIIGAVGNNDLGVAGINWQVKLMAVKGFPLEGPMSMEMELEALNYILYMKTEANCNIVAVNASFGYSGAPDTNERDAIDALGQAGILFIAAAGNEGEDNDGDPQFVHYPSSYDLDNIIAVAATTELGGLASFSNYGATSVDLGAPGDEILSTMLHTVETISYDVNPETAVFYDDLESGAVNFTLEGPWAITEENASTPSHALSDSPGTDYGVSSDVAATSRIIDLSGETTELALGLKAMHEIELAWDKLQVWYLAPPILGDIAQDAIIPQAWRITQENAASGNSSWTDSPGGNYSSNTNQWLLSPVVDLSSAPDNIQFSFKLTGEIEGLHDSFTVYFSGDNGVTRSEPVFSIDGDYSSGWQEFSAVIPEAYRTDTFRAIFVLTSDDSVNKDGYYLDDIKIASGDEVLFYDDVENGVGLWREPRSGAVFPVPSKWEAAGEFSGSSEGCFKSYAYEIPEKYFWDGFRFKFVMHSDSGNQMDGVYIDDIGIGLPEKIYGYKYMSGTSMATPQVTGAAALVAAAFGGISADDIKTRILDGAVPVNVLAGKTLTGRHLNLFGALSDLSLDSDNDTIPDYLDNCALTPNTDQRDTDNDGFGNMCDCDLDNDNIVRFSDFSLFREAWNTTDPDAGFRPRAVPLFTPVI
ncbi:MAG: hypothetical protein CSA25_05100 [Desulfobacter postgatei]|uniref:MAM domain-containing protein n=1 Tax=Desulfobacter postgatei TaxID=2293 RepID=A0A2G6MR50_9BACT|nr:MAG: hypothetical protein CSA25_05100 [Desulfobacter postgatei]